MRYLYEGGELEGLVYKKGDQKQRAIEPVWSVDVYKVGRVVFGELGQPNLYYLKGEGNVKTPIRNFVREELQVVLSSLFFLASLFIFSVSSSLELFLKNVLKHFLKKNIVFLFFYFIKITEF